MEQKADNNVWDRNPVLIEKLREWYASNSNKFHGRMVTIGFFVADDSHGIERALLTEDSPINQGRLFSEWYEKTGRLILEAEELYQSVPEEFKAPQNINTYDLWQIGGYLQKARTALDELKGFEIECKPGTTIHFIQSPNKIKELYEAGCGINEMLGYLWRFLGGPSGLLRHKDK